MAEDGTLRKDAVEDVNAAAATVESAEMTGPDAGRVIAPVTTAGVGEKHWSAAPVAPLDVVPSAHAQIASDVAVAGVFS